MAKENLAMMDVFECIGTRRSIRKFRREEVPMELIGMVIDAGRYAPSAGNSQNWRFVIVRDPEKKAHIADACMQQLWMTEASHLIVVCAESEKLSKFYGVRGERLYLIQNCAACIQNMLLAAHAQGLGSCWIGAYDESIIKRILSIPDDVKVQAVLPIGYPDEVVPAPMRFTMENLCFIESYGSRIANMKRVLQNPDIFGQMEQRIKGLVGIGKDIAEKAKAKFSKK